MDARSKALQHFRKEKRSSRDSFELPKMKKVSVMADSEKGLEEGLEKAQEIIENPKAISDMMEESEEQEESGEMEESDLSSMSQEELIEMIKELKSKLSESEMEEE